ncbi:hypothetical protein HN011_012427 [Eciton burchellii]|nr:hypothetical protein HN011_012427 [Eciton burchellii]
MQTADPLSVPSAGISPCLRRILAAEEWPAEQAEEARCEGSSSSPLVHSCSRVSRLSGTKLQRTCPCKRRHSSCQPSLKIASRVDNACTYSPFQSLCARNQESREETRPNRDFRSRAGQWRIYISIHEMRPPGVRKTFPALSPESADLHALDPFKSRSTRHVKVTDAIALGRAGSPYGTWEILQTPPTPEKTPTPYVVCVSTCKPDATK